eukprot:scaffold1106_cov608-Prasinococcus_capsulatus_cf.AAC.24
MPLLGGPGLGARWNGRESVGSNVKPSQTARALTVPRTWSRLLGAAPSTPPGSATGRGCGLSNARL